MPNSSYKVHTLAVGPMDNLVYLIEDTATKKTAVVDPAWAVDAIIETAQQHDLMIEHIYLTPAHHDLITGIEDFL
jgi:glyoxylase-like metal-dependent hydrolase (beta-lactamase superfamily II)